MCNYCNFGTCGSSLWGCGCQRICRDCCGNIRVSNCGCNCYNHCDTCNNGGSTQNGCNAYVNTCGNVTTANNTSVSACGYQNSRACQGTTTGNTDVYYARQYGLYGYSGCPCGGGYTYDTTES